MTTLQTANKIASWLEKSYINYLRYLQLVGERVKYNGNLSGNWSAGDSLRISRIANECPKRHGAIINNLIEPEELSIESLIRMEDGTRTAEIVYEGLSWTCQHNPDFTMEAEVRIKDHYTGLVGTIDAVLTYRNELKFCMEIKRTDIDQYFMYPRGISLSHVLQTIGEMILLSTPDKQCPFGFVFTRYNAKSIPPYKIWTILRVDDGWVLYDKEWPVLHSKDKWPVNERGEIFISDSEYWKIIKQHDFYAKSSDPIAEAPPYEFGANYHCCSVIAADYYSPKGKYHGGKKPNTGIVKVRCPLFHECFKEKITELGYDPELKEKEYDYDDI